jgi:hypothetical protein
MNRYSRSVVKLLKTNHSSADERNSTDSGLQMYTSDRRNRTWSQGNVLVTVAHWQRPRRAPTFDHLLASTVGMVSLLREERRIPPAHGVVGSSRQRPQSRSVTSVQTLVSPIFRAHDHTLQYWYRVSSLMMTISTSGAVWNFQLSFGFRVWPWPLAMKCYPGVKYDWFLKL